MSKRKLSTSRHNTSSVESNTEEAIHWLSRSMGSTKFIGVALAGGKTDKTALAVLDYFPKQKKIFLSLVVPKIKSNEEYSSDQKLIDLIDENSEDLSSVAFNVPLRLPKCMRCDLQCPGYEKCEEEEIKWLWKNYKKYSKGKKPKKLFTPYTERCIDRYLATELEEPFQPPHALGANLAPLTTRALFLAKRIAVPCIETHAKPSLWRIGRSLKIQKSYLRFHKHSVSGEEARSSILDKLIEKDIAFIYEQDRRMIVEDNHVFEAFLAGLTSILFYQNQCEEPPKDFPENEGWFALPKAQIDW